MLDTQNANGFHEDLVRRVGPKLDSQALPGQYHRTLGVKTQTHLSDLTPASRALLLSQAGPRDDVTIPSALFRVLLLRRLRLPLPLAPRRCSCRGQLDPSGDHRAACATSGVLPTRALPLELTVARVCREAGARVARNVRLADMNVDVPVADARRIEVVANGLPLWHRSQLALDATIVSPLTRLGEAHPRADVSPAVLSMPLRAGSDIKPTLNSPAPGNAASSLSASRLAAGLALKPCSSCACSRDTRRRLFLPHQTCRDHGLGCALVRALGGRSSARLCGLSPRAPPRRRARRRPRVARTSRRDALGPRLACGVLH